jgi:anti-sigma factor RsiW
MTNLDRLSPRDLETLSAFLDGQLDRSELRKVEAKLEQDAELKLALEQLQVTSAALSSLPEIRPPRNFALTEEMVGSRPRGRAYPFLQLSTALAGLAFVIVVGADLLQARGAAGTLLVSEAELEVESLQRAAEADSEPQLGLEDEVAAAPAAAADAAQESAVGEVVEEAPAEGGQEFAAGETAEEATAEAEQEVAAGDESEEDAALVEAPTEDSEDRAALELTQQATPAPLGTPAPVVPDEEAAGLAPEESAPSEPIIDELGAELVSEPSSQTSITSIRIAEIGLGVATLLLLVLTLLVRMRG